jgi:GAF domain-containing protein
MQSDDDLNGQMKTQLAQLSAVLEASSRGLLPTSSDELLETIVEAAARIFGAAAASIALVLEEEGALEFKVAYGSGNQEVVGQRIPIDAGIAGYVAMTGQPMAISDVRTDPRFDREFAESTGYVPDSILATPLLWEDEVIGVMEVLDKVDAPAFGMADIELMGIFARQASIAIRQSQVHSALDQALIKGIAQIAAESGELELGTLLDAISKSALGDPTWSELVEIAELLAKFSQAGGEERALALQILRSLHAYLGAQRFNR